MTGHGRLLAYLVILGLAICLPASGALAIAPPDPPSEALTVTDESEPFDDLRVNFGEVAEGSGPFSNTLTLSNTGNTEIVLGVLYLAAGLDFDLPVIDDTCSGQTLAPTVGQCTVSVGFATSSGTGDYFDIVTVPYDDMSLLDIYLGGRVLTDQAVNARPGAPELVSPSSGATGVALSLTHMWNESLDPDGDAVLYDLFVCAGDSTFAGDCATPYASGISVASAGDMRWNAYVSACFGIFGIAMASGISRKRRLALLLIAAALTVMLVASCGGGGDDAVVGTGPTPTSDLSYDVTGLSTTTTYYWKVVAEDSFGNRTDSEVWSYTTN